MVYFYIVSLIISLFSGLALLWYVPIFPNKSTAFNPKKNSLSIIIPARNEENNIPILLESLKKQTYQPLEVLVIDDHSLDNTIQIATNFGAEVIQCPTDEHGWVGKSAACWYGAQAAAGDWLLFLDADIFFPETDGLLKIMCQFKEEEVLSIQPYHIIKKSYENLSALFNILVLAGMNQFSILGNKLQAAGAFGPSLLCSRAQYFEVGGHKKVRGAIMENITLGQRFMEQNIPVSLYSGKDTLHFRMYPDGLKHLFEGWSKSFASGSVETHPFLLACTSLWIAGAFITPLYLFIAAVKGTSFELILAVSGYILFSILFSYMARKAGNFKRLVMFFYPLLFGYFVCLFSWSAIKTFIFKSVNWKGRKIQF